MPAIKPLSVQTLPLGQLEAAPYNPRRISDEALAGLKASVKRFGLVEPIVWNKRTKHVVGGHQRIKVLREMGHDETQVVIVDLPAREEKALNLALNNPHIAGEFTDGVAEMVEEIGLEAMSLVEELRLGELVLPDIPKSDIDAGPQLGGLEYRVVVDCQDEAHQRQVIDLLDREGVECRALIS